MPPQSEPVLDNTARVWECLLACAKASVLETMAKEIKLFDCGMKSLTNPSTSQTNVQIDPNEQDENKWKTKCKFVKSKGEVSWHLLAEQQIIL